MCTHIHIPPNRSKSRKWKNISICLCVLTFAISMDWVKCHFSMCFEFNNQIDRECESGKTQANAYVSPLSVYVCIYIYEYRHTYTYTSICMYIYIYIYAYRKWRNIRIYQCFFHLRSLDRFGY